MKKLIIILLLIPSLCFGNDAALIMGKAPSAISTILGKAKAGVSSFAGAGVAAAACSTGTLDQNQTAGVASLAATSDVARGQSFQVTATSYLYSIQMELSGGGTASDCATMRWGTSANLTSGALGTVQVCNIGSKGYVEFKFQNTTNQLETSTAYYFGIVEDSGDLTIYRNEANVYENGGYIYGAYGSAWNMSNTATYEMNFKVYVCN